MGAAYPLLWFSPQISWLVAFYLFFLLLHLLLLLLLLLPSSVRLRVVLFSSDPTRSGGWTFSFSPFWRLFYLFVFLQLCEPCAMSAKVTSSSSAHSAVFFFYPQKKYFKKIGRISDVMTHTLNKRTTQTQTHTHENNSTPPLFFFIM